eukprot:CAMPEP_0170199508 /NCGR_PEP_ID=MMETSP0040_2-20121228/69378_1 /TAXON_ID=641309 /ORGANISM="Lotharella oceanica, Strain CCMP622" /LENGTH=590 /DNA_ID=CAMNT_0010449637 /DNA_START=426 /DNA_END=2198 /DNA_ORIENTATION=-
MNCELGQEVGYSIRFDDNYDVMRTKIKYVTDGMLIRECMSDPLLTRYSVVMVDEAHERTMATDIILGLLRKICIKRPDLRVIISSATLDAKKFKKFFETNKSGKEALDTARVLSVDGRCYPVEIMYAKEPVRNYLQASVDTALYIHTRRGPGDILVFLTGSHEIDQAYELLRTAPRDLIVMRLYGGMQAKDQQRVFRPAPRHCRKVVLATNIAETSVTIDGIVYVVDCGFVKLPSYNPITSIQQLHVTPVSKSQARQRSGRAGRVKSGVCYRLYTEKAFKSLPTRTIPEIQRTRLDIPMLQLKVLGISDVLNFPFMSGPPPPLVEDALELLFACQALDRHGRLTSPIGEALAEFPVDPKLGRMLLASGDLECSEQALSIAAMLSVQSVFHIPRFHRSDAYKAHKALQMREGDHLTLLNVYNAFLDSGKDPEWCRENHLKYAALRRANEIRKHLRRALKRRGVEIKELDENTDEAAVTLIKCVLTGYFPNVAQLTPGGKYVTVRGGQQLTPARGSVLYGSGHRWVVFHEVVETTAGRQMREITAIQPSWLQDVARHYYKYTGVDAVRSRGESSEANKKQEGKQGTKFRKLF